MPIRRPINRDQPSFFCGGRCPTRRPLRRRRNNRPARPWATHTPTPDSMIGPPVASRERLAYYPAQPPIVAVVSVMKLRRSSEHRKNDPTVSGRAGPKATLGRQCPAPLVRNGRSRCARPSYGIAALASVGALLLSFPVGTLSADAAQ